MNPLRMRRRVPPQRDGFAEIVQAARIRDYGEGLADGMAITLRLLLGDPQEPGTPCPGPIPPNVEGWAKVALGKLDARDPGMIAGYADVIVARRRGT